MFNKEDNGIRKTLASIGDDLTFEEKGHKYFYKDNLFKSVTTILKDFFPFDAMGVATKLSESNNPKWRDYTPQEILDMWASKRDFGTARHQFAEDYLNGEFVTIEDPMDMITLRYLQRLKFQDVLTEVCIAAPDWGISGMIDALIKIDGKWWIYDWKTDARVSTKAFNKGDKCPGVLAEFDNCNFNKYSFQLGFYKLILETFYDIPIEGIKVVHLTEDKAVEYNVPYHIEYIGLLLKNWLAVNNTK